MSIIVDNIKKYDWKISVTRPSTLLERSLRCRGHGLAGLKHVLVISVDGVCQNYLDAHEWELGVKRVKKLVKNNKIKAKIAQYKKFFSTIKILNKGDPEYFFGIYAKITEANIFRRYLENIMEEDSQLRLMAGQIAVLHNDARILKDRLYDKFVSLVNKKIEWFLPEEIVLFIKNKKTISNEVIAARKKSYLGWYERGKFSVTTDKKIISAVNCFLKKSIEVAADKIEGVGVYPGICQGKIRVIRQLKDFKKLRPGEIIACTMFEPRMAYFSAHARAIITDEGGITCHATVISRENKIPCVIGTKIATQVFKNGDLVEVDANAGVIKRL